MDRKGKLIVLACTLCIVGLIGMIIFQGCSLFDGADRHGGAPTGNLVLTVTPPISPLVLLPGGDNTVDHYTVTVSPTTLPDPPSVQVVPAPPPVEGVLFENLKEDTYVIDIGGFTVGDELITQGTDVIFIAANTQEEVTIQMGILSGTGDVAIDLTITPPDLVPYDIVLGSWYDGAEWTASPWVQASQGIWDLDKVCNVGYHLQVWELFSEGYETFKVAGAAEAVYVRANRTTAGLYDLNESNIGPALEEGSAIVIIWEVIQPIQTYFTDGLSEVIVGSEFTLTTTTDLGEDLDLHHWYIDGVALDPQVDSPNLTQTAPLEAGMANYSKIGFSGSIITSASKLIVFVIPVGSADFTVPDGYIHIPNTVLDYDFTLTALDINSDPFTGTLYLKEGGSADCNDHITTPVSVLVVDGSVSFTCTSDGFPFTISDEFCLDAYKDEALTQYLKTSDRYCFDG